MKRRGKYKVLTITWKLFNEINKMFTCSVSLDEFMPRSNNVTT